MLINRPLVEIGVGRVCRGSSGALPLAQTQLLHRRRGKMLFYSTPLQQEGGGSPPSPATAQPMKSHYTSNSQPPPMDSLLTTAPLSSPFLYQRTFLAFVLLACRWFALEPHVPNCHSLLFPNKPIVLEKYLFQVNSPLKCREWAEKFLERSL